MSKSFLQIGRVRKEIPATRDPKWVPELPEKIVRQYFPKPNTKAGQSVLQHLQWLMQKDILGQDMFLLGAPGPFRRRLVRYYCHLAHRELETLAVTADTSESDLKEHREVVANSAKGSHVFFVDQPPLQAAIHGRILLLEDVHKAERNVLPTLNNLLENREMNLTSGRRLVHPLSNAASAAPTSSQQTLVCSENFRVIALGCPVPMFPGYPLDPPFRSRFQCRNVEDPHSLLSALELLEEMRIIVADDAVRTFVCDMYASLPWPPSPLVLDGSSGATAAKVSADGNAEATLSSGTCYAPHCLIKPLFDKLRSVGPLTVDSARDAFLTSYPYASLLPQQSQLLAAPWRHAAEHPTYFSLAQLRERLQSNVSQSRRTCIIGPRGCGKTSSVVHAFRSAGRKFIVLHCFKDMGVQDLLQRRVLDEWGNSSWQTSGLVEAAVSGDCVVLDGVHRVPAGFLEILSSLVHDAIIRLPSGQKLVPKDTGGSSLSNSEDVRTVHPNFFIVGIGEHNSVEYPWMTTGVLSLFDDFLAMGQPSARELVDSWVLDNSTAVPLSAAEKDQLATTFKLLSEHANVSPRCAHRLLDTFAHSQSCKESSNVRGFFADGLHRSLMVDFLPATVRKNCEEILRQYRGEPVAAALEPIDVVVDETAHTLRIGDLTVPRSPKATCIASLVPYAPNFVPIQSHARILYQIVKEMQPPLSLRHFLLIGNQGTGKNKLCDALMGMLWREREYIQLNRDTTVQSLTMTASVEGSKMRWDLSPLLKAMVTGRVAVVDEADKAPLEAVCVLKALLWDEFLTLPNGQCIRRAYPGEQIETDPAHTQDVLYIHPRFQCFVLANRPGFPFLGNDFFRECGDIFSTYIVHNPDLDSELQLVRAYAPNVSHHLLSQLCVAFEKLRELVHKGELHYPFSTREIVNIAKHLNAFPKDPVWASIRNAMDFDSYTPHIQQLVKSQFEESGLVLEQGTVALADAVQLPQLTPSGELADAEYDVGRLGNTLRHAATFDLTVRDVGNEIAHDMRPVALRRFANPRSYQFTNLFAEVQLMAFSSPNGTIHPTRRVCKVIETKTTETNQAILVMLADQPQGLYLVPLLDLDASASSDATSNNNSSSCSVSAREVDLSFVGGKVTTIVPLENHAFAVISLEQALVWIVTLAEKSGCNTMHRFVIPSVVYTGAGPDVPAHMPRASSAANTEENIREAVRGISVRVKPAQTMGKRYADAETYMACTATVIGTIASIVVTNAATGVGAVFRWGQRGASGVPLEWRPRVHVSFFAADTSPLANATITTSEVQALSSWVIGTSGEGTSVVRCLPCRSETAALLHTTPDAPPQGRKTVAELMKESRMKRALQSPTSEQSLPSAPPTCSASVLMTTSCCCSFAYSTTVLSLTLSTLSKPARRLQLDIPVAELTGQYLHAVAVLRVDAASLLLSLQMLSRDDGAEKGSEELWLLDHLSMETGAAAPSLRRIRRSDPHDTEKVLTLQRNGGFKNAAVFATATPTASEAPTLVVVGADGMIEWYDVDDERLATSLQRWRTDSGAADKHRELVIAHIESQSESRGTGEAAMADDIAALGSPDDLGFATQGTPRPSGGEPASAENSNGGGQGSGSGSGSGSGGSGGSGSGGSGGGGGGGSGSGSNLVGDGNGGFSRDQNGNLTATLSRRRTTAAKVVLSQSTGSNIYDRCLTNVNSEIARVTAILEAAEVKEKERVWQGNRIQGELDDRKLVEAVIGEPNVYRRRGIPTSPLGLPQRKPKYIDVLVDVSASMARFNGWDSRLDRLCESVVMIMESAKSFSHKFVVDVHGHSGSSARTPFLRCSSASSALVDTPTNDLLLQAIRTVGGLAPEGALPTSVLKLQDRVRVIDSMVSHARTTTSGDGTIDALKLAIEHCNRICNDVDESFVILVSDANLGSYGITPKELNDILASTSSSSKRSDDVGSKFVPSCNVSMVFISEKEAAEYLTKGLPRGVGHHCPTTKDMPQILRDILLGALV